MSPDELEKVRERDVEQTWIKEGIVADNDGDQACLDRHALLQHISNLERINRALGTVVERQWQQIGNFKHTNGCWMFCDERGNRWIDTDPDMFHVNGCGFPATHFRELPAPPGAGT